MNHPDIEAILDAWEVGTLSTQEAAGKLSYIFRFAVHTPGWHRRASGVGEPIEALDGLLYEVLVEKVPKYLRCYRTKLLTLALQGLKDKLTGLEGGRERRKRTQETAQADPSIWVGPSSGPCFLEWLTEYAAEIADGHQAGRGTLAGQRHRQLITSVVQGAPLSLAARSAGISTDLARRVLARDFAVFAQARGIEAREMPQVAKGVI